jgi:hypothetical protein
MPEPVLFLLISFLLAMLMVYLWASQRNLIKNRALTLQEYLWKLNQITGKSEYELFHIAAQEKGWPSYQVEIHFKRYLENQALPDYVKDFLEDGKEYINAYRPRSGNFIDKKLAIYYSLFTLFIIGGSFVFCLYIYPRIFQFDGLSNIVIANAIEINPRLAQPFIKRAISYGEKGQIEKACSDLKLACDLGYCEDYYMKKREGVCQ